MYLAMLQANQGYYSYDNTLPYELEVHTACMKHDALIRLKSPGDPEHGLESSHNRWKTSFGPLHKNLAI